MITIKELIEVITRYKTYLKIPQNWRYNKVLMDRVWSIVSSKNYNDYDLDYDIFFIIRLLRDKDIRNQLIRGNK